MKFNSDEIAAVIQKEIEQFGSQIDVREVGTVLEVGDGIARVYGLSGVMSGEMVEFPSGVIGLAFNLEEKSVGVIILGDYLSINEGDEVRALTGLSATTIWREICAGRFPAPVALSPNRRAFRAREVAQWMHSRSKAFGPGVR